MNLERFDIKRIYYYVICAVTLFILMWGIVDAVAVGINFVWYKASTPVYAPPGAGGEGGERLEGPYSGYYQRQFLYERMGDSLLRIIIPGALFAYFSWKLYKLEGGKT